MSNTKKYTAEEVARMIADRAAEIMKKHEISSEYMEQILEKSKNTAHEIDAGEEPNNDDAECPASLGGEGSSEKSESSEDASMEDEPLQGDNDSDTEEEETEEDEDEDEEDEYEFAKSEACGHTIEYKRLAKRCWEGYEPTPGKKAYTKGSCQKKSEDGLSEKQKEKMDTDKDGDIDAEDLKNLRHAKKSEDNIKFKHSNEAGQQTDQSEAQQAVSGIKRKASLEDQSEGKKQKRHRMNVDRAEGGKTYGKKSDRVEDKGVEAREEGRRSASAPKYEGPERRSKQRVRGQGHIYKKSESGMHTIEYKRLAKSSEKGVNKPVGGKYSGTSEQGAGQAELKRLAHHGVDLQTRDEAREVENKKNKKKSKARIKSLKNTKPNLPKSEDMDKCGEMTYKSESGMFTVEYNRLAKGVMATKEQLAAIRKPKSAANKPKTKLVDQMVEHAQQGKKTGIPLVDNQIADALGEKRMATQAERAAAGLKSKQSESKQNSSVPKMAASEDSKVKETEGIEFDKKQDADKTKEEKKGVKRPLEKCGEIKKEEMDKCGEMSSGKKLKKFLGKMKKPSPGMIQEPQE